jgi:transcriptional regulator NrdR family protein
METHRNSAIDEIGVRFETLKRATRLIELIKEDFPESTYRNALLFDIEALLSKRPTQVEIVLEQLSSVRSECQIAVERAVSLERVKQYVMLEWLNGLPRLLVSVVLVWGLRAPIQWNDSYRWHIKG